VSVLDVAGTEAMIAEIERDWGGIDILVNNAGVSQAMPLALMEEALVPVFLHHRYQVEAAASALGGQYYVYSLRGDGEQARRPVPAAEQMAALEALAATLKSSELVVPKRALDMLAPRPAGFDLHRELFPRYTGLPFDPITPGLSAADLTITFVLDPARAARLVSQEAYDPTLPLLGHVIDRLITAIFDDRPSNPYEAEVNRAVERAFVERLITLAGQAPMPQVRAVATARLRRVAARLRSLTGLSDAHAAHVQLIVADINRFITRPLPAIPPMALPRTPSGAPIGGSATSFLSHDEDWCGVGAPEHRQPFFLPLFSERQPASTSGAR